MNYARTKYCFVPNCKNSSRTSAHKIFLCIPYNFEIREKWFQAVGNVNSMLQRHAKLYCCEDHFDLPNDVENWTFFKMFGTKLKLKKNIVPHIFPIQDNLKSQFSDQDKEIKRKLIEEFEKGAKCKNAHLETSATVPETCTDNTILSNLLHNIPNIENHTIILVRDDLNQQNVNNIQENNLTNSASLVNKKEPVRIIIKKRRINKTIESTSINQQIEQEPKLEIKQEEIDTEEYNLIKHEIIDEDILPHSKMPKPEIKMKVKEELVEEPTEFEFISVNIKTEPNFYYEDS